MKFSEYIPFALRTAKQYPTQAQNLDHAAQGLITEIGEFAGPVKRMSIYGKPMTPEFLRGMREELGDVLWYCAIAVNALNHADIAPVLEDNTFKMPENLPALAKSLHVMSAGYVTCASFEQHPEHADHFSAWHMISSLVMTIDHCAPILLGISGDELRAQNIAKLRERYPEQYTDHAAEARADKGGLDANHS